MALLLQSPDDLQLVVVGDSGKHAREGVQHGQAIYREFI